MHVPFLDLKAQYESISDEIAAALRAVIDRCAFAGGPFVERFEEDFASFCGCRHALGVGSGTEAIWLALMALGIGAGDEVITVPNTFIATAEAISLCGAKPVFVDIDEQTYNMDPSLLEAAITTRTKALIPVHLFGQTAEMNPILDVAREHGLAVIEDACQAHGAEYNGRSAGSMGEAGCFSFYPGKNLGAYGEAGVVVTNNTDLDEKIRMLRDHGQAKKYQHALVGWNARMDGLQGAILSVKLRYLNAWNEARRKNAALYNDLLIEDQGIIIPYEAPGAKHVYHVYAIRAQDREALLRVLAEKEVHCGIHYPVPIHLQDAYQDLGYHHGSFPVAERCAAEFLSLPMFPELTSRQIEHVASEIAKSLAQSTLPYAAANQAPHPVA